MNPRRFHRWTIWLLPLLLARAFIPAGFMLSADGGDLSLIFCSGTSTAKAAGEYQRPTHDHGAPHAQHHDGADSTQVQDNAPCPFALTGSVVSAPLPHLADAAYEPSDERIRFESPSLPGIGPVRADRIRGPPARA